MGRGTMTYISAEQSRLFDDFAINKMGISSVVLMERAALAVYRRLLESPNFSLKKSFSYRRNWQQWRRWCSCGTVASSKRHFSHDLVARRPPKSIN